ncbi:hemicentin-1-like [Amphiprion ocellaris]|uniref:Ig-like domain-containing protein n=1 Tax=Amphiprion ocellaris TaxID=80972 RepID=A0AAQ5Y1B3_AMPOC|nr:hemicentin-1-like [Amphiprion ocellaris]
MVHHAAALLLLLLTWPAGFSASETEQSGHVEATSYGPSSVQISGVDIVTVGILYGFQCSANCYPDCQFTWTENNVTSEGSELSLKLLQVEPMLVLTCKAVNSATGESVSVQKTLQVTAGPSNIQISGPAYLSATGASKYTCSADCYPSCSYTWKVLVDNEVFSTSQGDTISITPPTSTVNSETVICQAQDTVSQLYISTIQKLYVATLSDISISGDSTVTMGEQYTFICFAQCIPPCTFIWSYMGKIFQGDKVQIPILNQGQMPNKESRIEITVSDSSTTESLTCQASNSGTHQTITATKNLTVIDPISVRPSSQALPVADKSFTLQCVGSQNPASIMWLKNKQPMMASERISFSVDNSSVTFSPLLQTDDGLYQCVVSEVDTPIKSVGYQMQVDYGPSSVVISGVDVVTVGILYGFQCLANCYPTCTFTWIWGNSTSDGSEFSLKLSELQSAQNLTCTAVNPATRESLTAQKTLQVTAGPSNIQIVGPTFLTAGVRSNFSCSAHCFPSCSYSWTGVSIEGEFSSEQGSTISITPTNTTTFENLTCKAQDTVSQQYILRSLALLVAIGPTKMEMVKPNNALVAEVLYILPGSTTELQCLADCFPTCSITWFYNNTLLATNASILFTPDTSQYKAALTCVASNPLSKENKTAETTVVVSDGPKDVVISGPNSLEIGVTSSFKCSAECTPSCSFTWTLYGNNVKGDVIDITVNRHISSESISCRAENTVTKRTATVNETLSVSEPQWCGC